MSRFKCGTYHCWCCEECQIDIFNLKPLEMYAERLNKKEPTDNKIAKSICAKLEEIANVCADIVFCFPG